MNLIWIIIGVIAFPIGFFPVLIVNWRRGRTLNYNVRETVNDWLSVALRE